MRKKNVIVPALFFAVGIVGMILRKVQLETIFDPVSGLANPSPVNTALTALTLAVIAGAVAFAWPIKKELGKFDPLYAFPVSGKVELGALTVFGSLLGVCAVLNFVLDKTETAVIKGIFAVIGVLTAVSVVLSALRAAKGEKAAGGVLSVIPPLFAAWWLVVTYKDNNTNPVLLEYCWSCLAAAAATTAFYYAAGFDYGIRHVRRTVVSHLLAVYFCLVAVPDGGNIALSAAWIAIAGIMLTRLWAMLSGRQPEAVEPEKKSEE